MTDKADNAAEVVDETPEVESTEGVHSSIADLLSHDPDADALGGRGLLDEAAESDEVAATEEKAETEEVATAATEKEETGEDLQKQLDAFKAQALDERSKRQRLEESIRAGQKPIEKADLFEDPDTRLSQELDPLRNEFNNRLIAMSESQAKARHSDFDQKYEAFVAATQSDPTLINQAMGAVDPGEFVYRAGEKQMLNQELGDGGLEGLRDKIRAEEKAKLDDAIKTGVEAKLAEISKLPPSAGKFSGKNNKRQAIDTNMSLSDILQE